MTKCEVYKWIEDHYRKNYRTLVGKLGGSGSKANAEDIVQTAYTRACQYWKSHDTYESFELWFNAILFNATRDFLREERMHGMVLDLDLMDEMLPPSTLKRIELQELLDRINEKTPHVARILKLSLIEGYKSNEVDEIVAESSANVRKIVQRFREEIGVISNEF